MNPKILRVVGGATGVAALTVYVLSGSAWITPADELKPMQVAAGSEWSSVNPRLPKPIRRASAFEVWPQDVPRPRGVTEVEAPPPGLDASVAVAGPPLGSSPAESPGDGATAPATVTRYPVTVDGIRDAIQQALPDIKECYEGWIRQQPTLGGKIVIGFQIGRSDAGAGGAVTELAIVDGGLGHALMEGCVMNAMQELAFEEPDEPITVNYPFQFSNLEDDGGP